MGFANSGLLQSFFRGGSINLRGGGGHALLEIFCHGQRLVGAYTGQILKGAEFADLPVVQWTKFEFVINLQNGQRARPRSAADARADGVIE
jgi:hypothetical protein